MYFGLNKKPKQFLGCFSPPVMITTFVVEITGALVVYWRYKTNKAQRLIISLLVCLGTFQLA